MRLSDAMRRESLAVAYRRVHYLSFARPAFYDLALGEGRLVDSMRQEVAPIVSSRLSQQALVEIFVND